MPKLTDKDLGWKRIVVELRALAGKKVNVGVLGNAPQHPSGVNMADIATWMEFGTEPSAITGHPGIPPRPTLRPTFDKNLKKYERFMSRRLRFLGRELDTSTLLGQLGLKMTNDIKRAIVALKEPPNRPSTIRSKGSSNPLIDTGRFRQSIDFEVKG